MYFVHPKTRPMQVGLKQEQEKLLLELAFLDSQEHQQDLVFHHQFLEHGDLLLILAKVKTKQESLNLQLVQLLVESLVLCSSSSFFFSWPSS